MLNTVRSPIKSACPKSARTSEGLNQLAFFAIRYQCSNGSSESGCFSLNSRIADLLITLKTTGYHKGNQTVKIREKAQGCGWIPHLNRSTCIESQSLRHARQAQVFVM